MSTTLPPLTKFLSRFPLIISRSYVSSRRHQLMSPALRVRASEGKSGVCCEGPGRGRRVSRAVKAECPGRARLADSRKGGDWSAGRAIGVVFGISREGSAASRVPRTRLGLFAGPTGDRKEKANAAARHSNRSGASLGTAGSRATSDTSRSLRSTRSAAYPSPPLPLPVPDPLQPPVLRSPIVPSTSASSAPGTKRT